MQGVDLSWFKEREWKKVAAGAALSVLTHEVAHFAVAEHKDLNPRFDNFVIWYDEPDEWVSRAGFLSQLIVGGVLNLLPATKGSDFTLGWNSVATAQLVTYHFRNEVGDFDDIGMNEWAVATGLSTINLFWSIKEAK